MDDVDFVETSDPEELEQLHAVEPRQARAVVPGYSPRKRRKVFHGPYSPPVWSSSPFPSSPTTGSSVVSLTDASTTDSTLRLDTPSSPLGGTEAEVTTKEEQADVEMDVHFSQDPLLLDSASPSPEVHSPGPRRNCAESIDSLFGGYSRSPSIDPLYMTNAETVSQSHRSSDERHSSAVSLPSASPPSQSVSVSPRPEHRNSSPLSSARSSPSRNKMIDLDLEMPSSPQSRGSPLPDANRVPEADQTPAPVDDMPEIPPELLPQRRNLRPRLPKQLHPYEYDAEVYRQAIKPYDPKAYIRVQQQDHVKRRGDHYEPDSDGEDSQGYEARVSKRSEHPDKEPQVWQQFETLANDLSDDEREIRATRNEARKAEKARLAKEKAEKEARRRERKEKDSVSREHQVFHRQYDRFPALPPNEPIGKCASPEDDSRSSTAGDTAPSPPRNEAESPTPQSSPGMPQNASFPNNYDFGDYFAGHVNDSDDERSQPHSDAAMDAVERPEVSSEEAHVSPQTSDNEREDPKKRDRARRILEHMYPKGLVDKLLGQNTKGSKRRAPTARNISPHSGDEDGEVVPGHAKRILASNAQRTTFNFEGDPDSSEDEVDRRSPTSLSSSDSPDSSDSDVVLVSHRRRTPFRPDADLDNASVLSSEDDVEIVDRPSSRNISSFRSGDIDYMLSRTYSPHPQKRRAPRQPGRDRKRSRKQTSIKTWASTHADRHQQSSADAGRSSDKPRFRHDIITGDARGLGRSHQTLLPFERADKASKSKSHRKHPRSLDGAVDEFTAPPAVDSPDVDMLAPDAGAPHNARLSRKAQRKLKEKQRKEQIKKNSVYTFFANDTHITDGRPKRRLARNFLIDFEDHGIEEAFAPAPIFKPGRRPLSRHSSASYDSVLPDRDDVPQQAPQTTPKSRVRCREDLGMALLRSGISFSSSTYLGKGWLHELTGLITGSLTPPVPFIATFDLVELGPTTNGEQLVQVFPDICSKLFDATTSLMDPEFQEQEFLKWDPILRVSCQLVSWVLAHNEESGSTDVRGALEQQISTLVTRLEEAAFDSTTMDILTIVACWFCVEIAIRLGCRFSDDIGSMLWKSTTLLVKYLLEYGLEQPMAAVFETEEGTLNDKSLPERAVEYWICLVHVGDACRSADSSTHPLWQIVLDRWKLDSGNDTSTSVSRCEKMWRMIFHLCTLGQFNVHGTSLMKPRLPACWTLPEIAMKQVRLVATVDTHLTAKALVARDRYVGLFPSRCFYLWKIWGWQLSISNAQPVFNQLTEIFRSRKFANLCHEKVDFPKFIQQADFSLLSQYEPTDSAYMLFLKLIVHVSQAEVAGSPKIRKLVSLAIPVGSLSITGSKSDHDGELSMVYNRFAASLVGLYLDPESYESRTTQVKSFVNFKSAGKWFRKAIIRGLLAWSSFLVELKKPLNLSVQWVQEVADVLLEEMKGPAGPSEDIISTSLISLLAAVRGIFKKIQNVGQYPDPHYLEVLKKFTALSNLVESYTGFVLVQVVRAFFSARECIVHPPAPVEESESQEEFRALDAIFDTRPIETPEQLDFLSPLMDRNFRWAVLRNIGWMVKHTDAMESLGDVDELVDCFIDCCHVVIQQKKRTWASNEGAQRQLIEKLEQSPYWKRRVDMRVAFRILQLDSFAFKDTPNFFITKFLFSLVVPDISWAHEFVSIILANPMNSHVLLKTIPCPVVDGKCRVERDEFLALRVPFIAAVFENLADTIRDLSPGTTCREIDICLETMSEMRQILLSFDSSSPKRAEYTEFCVNIVTALRSHAAIRDSQRFAFWITWEPS